MSFCVYCGAQMEDGSRFCSKCGKPVFVAAAEPQPAVENRMPEAGPAVPPADPSQDPVLYQGVCLKRESGWTTIPGDCLITPKGLFYYRRCEFRNQIGKRQYDFWVNSADVREIRTSVKNMNKVMELYMNDGAVLEFYSPKFGKMLSAMQIAVNGR